MFKTIVRYFLIFLILGLLLLLGMAFEVFFGWPPNSMWLWPILPLLVWVAFRLSRKAYVRYKAHHRLRELKGVETLDSDYDEDWIDAIRDYVNATSASGKRPLSGRDIYFVLGTPLSGKSTLLRSSVSSSHSNFTLRSNENPTANCEFTFLDSSLAVEFTGRNFDPSRDGSVLNEEWRRLIKTAKPDINPSDCKGILVTVAWSDITERQSDTLTSLKVIRHRIDDLMMISGKRLPVYVVLTQMNGASSFRQLISSLPADSVSQPVGCLIDPANNPDTGTYATAVDEIIRYLPWLQFRSHAQDSRSELHEAIVCGRTLALHRAEVESCLGMIFDSTSRAQGAIFRGLFLSSITLNDLEKDQLPSRSAHSVKQAFGVKFIDEIVREDRLSEPLDAYENWRMRQKTIRRLTFISLLFLLVVWIFSGYYLAIDRVTVMSKLKPIEDLSEKSLTETSQELLSVGTTVNFLEGLHDSRWRFFFPFSRHTVEVEGKIRQNFLRAFNEFRTQQVDAFVEKLENLTPEQKASAIQFFSSRYILLREALDGKDVRHDASVTDPNPNIVNVIDPEISLTEAVMLNDMYKDSLIFSSYNELLQKRSTYGPFVLSLLNRTEDLEWVLQWADSQPGVSDVNLSDYWNPTSGPSDIKVRGAFTIKGREAIKSLVAQINMVESAREYIQRVEDTFILKYRSERVNSWAIFVRSFREGEKLLKSRRDWFETLGTFNSDASPYRLIEERIINEFSEDPPEFTRPGWVQMLGTINAVRKAAPESLIEHLGGRLKIIQSSGHALVRSHLAAEQKIHSAKRLLESGSVYRVYLNALGKAVADAITGPGKASDLAFDYSAFGRDPKYKDSSFVDAINAEKRLEEVLNFNHHPEYELAWMLMRGELDSTMQYAYEQAACAVQEAWQSSVVWASKTATTDNEAFKKVVGDQGALWEFADKTAFAFLSKQTDRYQPTSMNGWALKWDPIFITYLNDAVKEKLEREKQDARNDAADKMLGDQDDARLKEVIARLAEIDKDLAIYDAATFPVKIAPLQVRANLGSTTQPHGSSLTLQCSEKQQELKHLNFSAEHVFNWNPKTCKDTQLSIFLGTATMIRQWPGRDGFIHFLQEYIGGERIYRPSDFLPFSDMLDAMGITKINQTYNIDGSRVLIDAWRKATSEVAEKAKLEAEKLKLEQAKALRDQYRLALKLDQLAPYAVHRPIVPENVSSCDIR